jgi:valyl-tRNA synthetase
MMEKTFDPAGVEARVSASWEEEGAFRAGRPERRGAEPYVIVIPPPNVTGSLHIGHALNNTLQDVLCRYHRMLGKDVLWQPGTDHAGIATQMVVERQMAERQEPGRREIGRDAFLQKVWAWKEESGGTIVRQLKRLGASCDWSRERFTMDAGLSAAVVEFFVRLHDAGLIYKDKRLVNWDPKFQTAISDLEVMQVEVKGSFKWQRPAADDTDGKPLDMAALRKLLAKQPGGHLYHLDYPLADGSGTITVATTRPETMLGDTAVAVHPDDDRYRRLIGQQVRLPLVNRLIPIVADTYSDPEKGTGAVKITPAHDFNDFEVGKRHGLAVINIFSREAALTLADNDAFLAGAAPEATVLALHGADRFAARARMIELLAECDALQRIEPTVTQVPHGDRSNDVIEPYLTEQWYVDTRPLADAAMASVREGRTRILPEQQEAAFFRWMENIEPWCISRQLWWGHQIPAWYGPDGTYVVARDEAEALAKGRARWGANCTLTRDEDVLDTWFSSALWPFSTLGWPEKTPDLARYYPTSALVTAADILFFWVARMMMTGLFTQGEVPFRDVYLHGLVRDEKGAKMSKSKGNVLDPLTIIDAYGADALRFAICINASQGRDIKLGMKSAELYRNFCTKIWNASRFAEMNGCAHQPGYDPARVSMALNRWILGELSKARAGIMAGIESYRFNDAAGAAYRFTWNLFCDWYLELSKPILQAEHDSADKAETRATTAYVLDAIYKLLHPFMPFLTEELWAQKGANDGAKTLLCLTPWPEAPLPVDSAADAEIGFVVDIISEIRSARAEMSVPAGAHIPMVMLSPGIDTAAYAARWGDLIRRLARLSAIETVDTPPAQSVQVLVRGEVIMLPMAGVIDIGAEKARLEREYQKCTSDIAAVDARLGNPDFVAKAPDEVIEEHKERRETALARQSRISEALSRL